MRVPDEIVYDWKRRTFPDEPCASILELHFHPAPDESLHLSKNDVRSVDYAVPGYDMRPVIVVGTVREDGCGHLLWLQKLFAGPLSANPSVSDQFWAQYDEHIRLWPRADFGTRVAVPGYIAAEVLKFTAPKGRGRADLLGMRRLSQFRSHYVT